MSSRAWTVLKVAGAAALLALLLAVPVLPLTKYQLHIVNLIAVAAILAMSLDLLFGYLGQMSLAHAAFYGVGAYTAALLTLHGILPFWAATLVAMAVCGLLGALLGTPAMRLTGFYLAMATMSFGIILSTLFVQSVGITGGPNGLLNIPPPEFLGTEIIGPQRGYAGNYYLILLAALIAVFVFLRRLTGGRTGRVIAAVRDSTLAAASVGINVRLVQVAVFATSCALAGLAGSLYAHLILYISPETFTFTNSLLALLGVVFGGIGSIWGPVVGAAILTVLGEAMRGFGAYQLILYAVGILVVLRLVPHGISGLITTLLERLAPRPPRASAAPHEDERASIVVPFNLPTRHDGSPILSVSGVSKRFGGVQALAEIGFEVREGEIKAVIGPNGSGKTTMFNAITGFETIDAGDVVFRGRSIRSRHAYAIARAGMARSFQIVQLFSRLSVRENLILAGQRRHPASLLASLLGLPSARRADGENARAADQLLVEAGLAEWSDRVAGTLPYGRQRVLEIARALATAPKLILLDEPAAGLNTAEAFGLAAYLRRVRARGVTVVIVEHNMPFVLGLADSVVVFDRGQRIADGTPDEVRRDERVIAAYLGAPAPREALRA